MQKALTLACALSALVPGSVWAQSDTAPPTLLVVGDSLSAAYGIERDAGWVALLAERVAHRAEVVNASISGETTGGGATRLPELLRQHDPDIVLLELGGNDGLRGLPPSQMSANLEGMIEKSQAAGAQVLLLGIDIPPNYGDAYRQAFTGVFRELADTHEVPLVPFLLEGVALDPELMQDDGIPPTAEAQSRLLDNVWPSLAPLLAETEESEGTEAASTSSASEESSEQASAS